MNDLCAVMVQMNQNQCLTDHEPQSDTVGYLWLEGAGHRFPILGAP